MGADEGIVDFGNAGAGELGADGGGEVDFVMRRADAGGDLRDDVRGLGSGGGEEDFERGGGDVEFRAFAAGVGEGDAASVAVDKIDRGAIGDMDAEGDTASGGDEGVGSGGGRGCGFGDEGDLVRVDLSGAGEGKAGEAKGVERGSLVLGEAGHGGEAVGAHIEIRDALEEGVEDAGEGGEGGEGFVGGFQEF